MSSIAPLALALVAGIAARAKRMPPVLQFMGAKMGRMEERLRNRPGVRQIAGGRVSSLPWLAPPAGYVILIQDVAYGSRYKIARHQRMDRHLLERGADLPFATRVALILEAEDAAIAERDLRDELAPGAAIGDWFDLDQFPKPTAGQRPASAPAEPTETVSLRDLARNDGDAESLLRDMRLVGAGSGASTPGGGRSAAGRRPRGKRWALLLLLIVAAAFASGRSTDIQSLINSVLAPSSTRATSRQPPSATRAALSQPTILLAERTEKSIRVNWQKMPQAKSYQVRYSVNGGALSRWKTVDRFTYELEGLSPGDRVTFHLRALRDGVFSPIARIDANALPAPTPTDAEGAGEVFYSMTRAVARKCASTRCGVVAGLETGTRIEALAMERGQRLLGNDQWVQFLRDGRTVYIHSSALRTDEPIAPPIATDRPAPTIAATAEPSSTPQPPTATDASANTLEPSATSTYRALPSATATDAPPTAAPSEIASATSTAIESPSVKYVVRTTGNANANIRACPRTNCDVLASFAPGTEIDVFGPVSGETVYGTDVWLEIELEAGRAFIHSELAEAES